MKNDIKNVQLTLEEKQKISSVMEKIIDRILKENDINRDDIHDEKTITYRYFAIQRMTSFLYENGEFEREKFAYCSNPLPLKK